MAKRLMDLFVMIAFFASLSALGDPPPAIKLTNETLLPAKKHAPNAPGQPAPPKPDQGPATSKPLRAGEHVVFDVTDDCLKRLERAT